MKSLYSVLFALAAAILAGSATAQTWRPHHAGLPSGFTAKSVYGEGSMILVANNSAFSGSQMYYTPDTSTPFTGSASSLGSFSPMETGVVKCMGIHFVASVAGVYKSHNNGVTWTAAGISGACYALYAYHDTLYASLGVGLGECEMSIDTGNTWTHIGYSGPLTTAIYKYNNVLYVGSTSTLKYTSDNGATWNNVTTPTTLAGHAISGITSLGSAVYAACDNGVFKSTDNGATWNNVLAKNIFCLTTIDTCLFGGTDLYGVYKSDQSGSGWTQIATGLPTSGGIYQTVNSISSNNYYVIASAQGDSAIYVINLTDLGLHPGTLATQQPVSSTDAIVVPNPAKNELTVIFPAPLSSGQVTIYDMAGRCQYTSKLGGTSRADIDVRNLPAGQYILQITDGGSTAAKRISIVR